MFQVKEVSKLLGLDRSFLHYYDEIGIIVPQKNEKSYRIYSENDLIAIASSKYYRAMDMSLNTLSQVILTSDYEKKVEMMEKQKEYCLSEATRYHDLAIVCDYALTTYNMAYQNKILDKQFSQSFSFLPFVHNEKCDESLISHKTIKDLLNFFPFVSYAYYFPINSLIQKEHFTYYLGLSIIEEFRIKYQKSLPENHFLSSSSSCLVFPITKNVDTEPFCYADFEVIRLYAKQQNIELTGEAIAYCVFTNYEHEHGKVKFVVQIITK